MEKHFNDLVRGEMRAILELSDLADAASMVGRMFERFMHRVFQQDSRPSLTLSGPLEGQQPTPLDIAVQAYKADWNPGKEKMVEGMCEPVLF